ncbi:hypothetical protein pqer_cds_1185 [Pandoravirus quercus]|uniref:Uncharacterized protein n=1 Tax=Pandoravirus quercus TaxID=2107709 RepID=A0A2U7UAY2_9VIRU|nr:hypothetical protein pqer_cds_1185 [Pandoravirus quercus]AVK75607.1 hypothetical protein pqer_cds_1185 [Pandoravirus quercus]
MEELSDDSGDASGAEHSINRPSRRQRTRGPPDDVGQDYEAVGLEEKLARCVTAFRRRSAVGRGPLASHTPLDPMFHDFARRWRMDWDTGVVSPTRATKALIDCVGDAMAYVVKETCVGDTTCKWILNAMDDEHVGGPVLGPTAVPPRKTIQRGRWHAYRLFRQCIDAIGLLEDPLLGLAAIGTVDWVAVEGCARMTGAEAKTVLPPGEPWLSSARRRARNSENKKEEEAHSHGAAEPGATTEAASSPRAKE